MKDKIFLDTNILVYLSNEDSLFHKTALEKFKQIVKKHEIWISRQVLREYAVVMSRLEVYEKTLRSQEIIDDIAKWEKSFKVADEAEGITENLKNLILRYNLKGRRIHDANIVASMMEYSIPLLFTFNIKDFKAFEEIQLLEIESKKEFEPDLENGAQNGDTPAGTETIS